MEKVIVLLSTYNGEKYLEKQIHSILTQKFVEVSLLIRDDGSNKETLEILKRFSKMSNVQIIYGKNIGWKRSFNELVNIVKSNSNNYYAFADQDDVWLNTKLFEAIKKLESFDIPALYHSNVSITDENLNFICNRFNNDFKPENKFPQYFFNGYGVGSTMVFNDRLLSIIQKYKPTQATNHDALVIALAHITGHVVYDKNSYILYRRHKGATTGFGTSTVTNSPSIIARYNKYKKGPKNQFSIRAQQILLGYSEYLNVEERKIFKWVANYRYDLKSKLHLLFNLRIKASGVRKTMQIKYRVMFNTL